jgi:enediyne biosynthesis protein E4
VTSIRWWLCLAVVWLGCNRPLAQSPRTESSNSVPSVGSTLSTGGDSRDDVSEQAEGPENLFEQPSAAFTNLKFAYSNGRSAAEYAIIESLGGGVGAIDFDADGLWDLYFAGGGGLHDQTVTSAAGGLFRNLGQWRFSDVTAESGTQAEAVFTHGVCVGDIDADGFDDLAISGYGGVQILLNQGDGTMLPMPLLVTDDQHPWSSSLALADLDQNGLLDLYVAHYVDWSWNKHPICAGQGAPREVCAPREFSGVTDAIYFNDGGFPLRRAVEEAGLVAGGKGLGVIVQDLNGDHAPDIYVANDTVDNFYYLNDGRGRFSEQAVLAGVSGDDAGVSTGSMGVVVFDYDRDDWPDILVTNFERELTGLYRNDGRGDFFTFASRQAGLATYGGQNVGFGAVAIDVDFDSNPDVVISNGHVSYHSPYAPYRQQPLLLMNNAGVFSRLATGGYFAEGHTGRGLASCDLDNDGDLDLAISHLEEPVAVLERVGQPPQRWASIRLVGTVDNRSAVGSVLRTLDAPQPATYYLPGGGSYLSSSDKRLLVYWPTQSSDSLPDNAPLLRVQVTWPSSQLETFLIDPGSENVLIQGTGQPND